MDPEIITQLAAAAGASQWVVFAALVVVVVVGIVRKLVEAETFPSKYVPAATAVLGLLLGVAAHLQDTSIPWWQALLLGLTTTAAAGGFWSLVGKHLFAKLGASPKE